MTIERAREIFDLDLATTSASDLRMRWHDLLRQHHPDLGDPAEEAARNEMTLRIKAPRARNQRVGGVKRGTKSAQ